MSIRYDQVDENVLKKLDKLFGVENCLIEVNPGNALITPKYMEIGERILNLEVRPDDVWLVSYPRSGSTWAQEMVWCIVNNLDYERAKLISQFRSPLLELTAVFGNDSREWKNGLGDSVELVESIPSPRCIKSHLPWVLLPTQLSVVKPKVIYVARNPKDVSVSYYHYCRLIHDFHGTYDDFCELFIQGKTPMGSMWKHVTEFWKRRNEPNILFLKYEDMKKDLRKTILQVSKFLNKSYSADQIDALVEHLSFSKMRENPAINLEPILQQMYNSTKREDVDDNKFIRKGKVGDWRNYMSVESAKKVDQLNEDNWNNIGLEFES